MTDTANVTNPNPLPIDLRTVGVCLPTGFMFVPGSTAGALKRGPAAGECTGRRVKVTWTKALTVPAGGRVTIRFKARAGTRGTGDVTVAATAAAPFTVTPSGPTATVTVSR